MPVAIGIDLGTCYSCIAVLRNGNVEIIVNEQGDTTTPNYIAFTEAERLVGDSALQQIAINPENTIFDVKRFIGCYSIEEFEPYVKHWPFKLVKKNKQFSVEVKFQNKIHHFCPEEISAMIISKLKDAAEVYLQEEVKNVVISVPACFNDSQRQATKDAACVAGLNVLRIINEPTAAALAYALDKNLTDDKCVLIYDLGAGTFDVSVLTFDGGSLFEIKSTAGNVHLGGQDFDYRLVEYLVQQFKEKYNKDLYTSRKAFQRLKSAAEYAKRVLSSNVEASIVLDGLFDDIDFYTKITRPKFEELCDDLFNLTIDLVAKALDNAQLSKIEIQEVILIGGSTRIPKIREKLKYFFHGKKLNFSMNPDEAVAYGAAVEAAILICDPTPKIQDILLVDVISFNIEIETFGGKIVTLINHNTRLPHKLSQFFTTYKENQSSVRLKVYETEKGINGKRRLLGKFNMKEIMPVPRGMSQIEIIFDLDSNGILHISAKENNTGYPKNIQISGGKHNVAIDRMTKMLLSMIVLRKLDYEQSERNTARNYFETYIFNAKQAVDKCGELLTEVEKDFRIQECDNMLCWLESNSSIEKDEVEKKKKVLKEICYPVILNE